MAVAHLGLRAPYPRWLHMLRRGMFALAALIVLAMGGGAFADPPLAFQVSPGSFFYPAYRGAFSQAFPTSGGAPPVQYSYASGNQLVPGLTLNEITGVISGTATAVGEYAVKLQALDGDENIALGNYTFRVGVPVGITSASPNSGALAGGTAVTIIGTNFQYDDGFGTMVDNVVSVDFGGTPGTGLTIIDQHSLIVTAPAHAAGSVNVTVTGTGNSNQATLAQGHTYSISTPHFTSASPSSGPPAGGTRVEIKGDDFQYDNGQGVMVANVSYVGFGEAAGTDLQIVDEHTLMITSPAGMLGQVDIVLAGQGDPSSQANAYAYVAPVPVVEYISPDQGAMAGGDSIDIIGSNLEGIRDVTFDGVSAPDFAVIDGQRVTALVPAHAAGIVDVVVSDGVNTVVAGSYTYFGPRSPTTMALAAVPNPSIIGQDVTLCATITTAGPGVPSGSLSITQEASGTIRNASLDENGVACLTSDQFATGEVLVRYSGSDGVMSFDGANGTIELVVNEAPPVVVSLSPVAGALPSATTGQAYTQSITASGITGEATFAVTEGALPAGMSLDGATGVLNGAPSAAGDYAFTITASQADDSMITGSAGYTLAVVQETVPPETPVTVTLSPAPGALPQATAGQGYTQSITASGITGAATFAVSAGALPAGVTLNPTTGMLSGSLAAHTEPSYAFTITATQADDPTITGSASYTLAVTQQTASPATIGLSPVSGDLPSAMAGEDYTQPITASGGTGPVLFSVTAGVLPPGMSLNRTNGTLSGPLNAGSEGTYGFTVTAVQADNHAITGSANYRLVAVKRAVTVQNTAIVVPPGGTPPMVDLTDGATGGPFNAAAVGTVTPAIAGTAEIIISDVAAAGPVVPAPLHFKLKFTPNPQFSGTAVVSFTLTSVLGVSNTGTVSFTTQVAVAAVGDRFDSLVHDFVSARQSLLSSAVQTPGLLQRRSMGAGTRPGVVDVSADGNAITLNFASSLAELQSWGETGDAAGSLAAAGAEATPFNFWIDGTATLHLRSDNGEDHWGNFGLLSAGGDYLINDRLLAGLAVHADFMSDLTDTSDTNGKGVLVGPYVSAEIADDVFFDASVYFGHSWNEVSAGLFAGSFESQRVLVNAKLEGEWAISDALMFRPNVTAFYLHEAVGDYTISDTLGNTIDLAGFNTDQIRLSAGGRLEYTMSVGDGLSLTPFIGASLGLSSTNGSAFTDGAFGMLSGGFTLSADGTWSLGGGVDLGLDADGLKSAAAKGRLSVNF